MDRKLMEKERGRLQAVLDGYNAGSSGQDHHPSLVLRIAVLDGRIAEAHDI